MRGEKFTLQMPPGRIAQLKAEAERQGRSASNLALFYIEYCLARQSEERSQAAPTPLYIVR